MTKLNKPISRETSKRISGRNVIVTFAPCGSQAEARVGFRLKGKRTQYVCTVSALYTIAALWHGNAEAKAKRDARKAGESWKYAKRRFIAANAI